MEPSEDMSKVPFEDALNKTGFGLYNYISICLAGMVIIGFATVVYGTTILIPASACELNTTVAQQGLLASAPVVGVIIGAMFWGYLGDTRGRKNTLIASLVTSAVVNGIASISVNWIMLMCLQFVASLLASGKYTLAMTLLSESVPMAKRNLVVLLVTSIFLLSQGIMAVLGIPIIPLSFSYYISALGIYWNSWRTLLLVYSAPSLITAFCLVFMQESPKFLYSKGNEAGALEVLRTIHKVNHGCRGAEYEVKSLLVIVPEKAETEKKPAAKDQIVPLFKPPLLKYTVIMTSLFVFQQVGAFAVWLPTILNRFFQLMSTGEGSDLTMCGIIHADIDIEEDPDAVPCAINTNALLMLFAVGALQSFANIIISLVVNCVGRRNLVIIVTATCGLAGILVNLVPNAIGTATLFAIFLIGILVLGLYTAITVALFPTHLRAMAVALTMTGGRASIIATIQILNYMLANSCEAGFYLFSALFASSAIIASFLPDDRYLNKPKPADIKKEEGDNLQDDQKTSEDTTTL